MNSAPLYKDGEYIQAKTRVPVANELRSNVPLIVLPSETRSLGKHPRLTMVVRYSQRSKGRRPRRPIRDATGITVTMAQRYVHTSEDGVESKGR